jgi:competence protein ComEC
MVSNRATLVLAGAVVVAAALALWRKKTFLLWLAGFALTVWLGAARYAQVVQIPASDVSNLPSTTLTIIGTVDGEITIQDDPNTDEPASAKFVMSVTDAQLDSGANRGNGRGTAVSGRLAVRMSLRSRLTDEPITIERLPQSGETVELRGRLETPDGPRNPGGFDYRGYLARQGIHSTFTVTRPEQLRVLAPPRLTNPLHGMASALRHRLLETSKRLLPVPYDGLLAGILIGDRHRIPPLIQEDFERTGTSHILATAGLHVGMVACLLAWALRECRVPRPRAVAASIALLAIFSVMAGERAAVLRAVIVASYYLFGELVEREPDLPNALAIAILALLVANPLDLTDPGFQLSFATVITIVLLMPAFQRLSTLIGTARRGEKGPVPVMRWIAARMTTLCLLSLAAQIGAAPLVAYYFYNVSLISVAANAAVVPAVFLVIALGFPMALLGSLHPLLAAPLALALRGILAYVLWTAHLCSEARFASLNVAPPSPVWIVGYYILVWSLAYCLRPRALMDGRCQATPFHRASQLLAAVSGAAVLAFGLWGFVTKHPKELRITFLDVGQGDACIMESPGGKALVLDTGGQLKEGADDQGRRVVAPYLRYRGISEIQAMILTHPHADHIGGAMSLLRRFPTQMVMDDGESYGSPLAPGLMGKAVRDGARIDVAHRGETLDFGDGVTAEVIAPSEQLRTEGANNASVVLLVRYGRTTFLLTGDAEAPEEADILTAYPDLKCDVIKAGHHGSRTSSTAPFIAAARPSIAIISVGKRNIYGHPSQEVIERLHASGATIYRTDRDGAITCHSDGVTVHVEKMLK